MMSQYIKASDAFYRLALPYRKGLDWLFSGKLRGRRRGKHWEASLEHVQELERELGRNRDVVPGVVRRTPPDELDQAG
jgi:hypothetical protein